MTDLCTIFESMPCDAAKWAIKMLAVCTYTSILYVQQCGAAGVALLSGGLPRDATTGRNLRNAAIRLLREHEAYSGINTELCVDYVLRYAGHLITGASSHIVSEFHDAVVQVWASQFDSELENSYRLSLIVAAHMAAAQDRGAGDLGRRCYEVAHHILAITERT
jgi:hypothetical protein